MSLMVKACGEGHTEDIQIIKHRDAGQFLNGNTAKTSLSKQQLPAMSDAPSTDTVGFSIYFLSSISALFAPIFSAVLDNRDEHTSSLPMWDEDVLLQR